MDARGEKRFKKVTVKKGWSYSKHLHFSTISPILLKTRLSLFSLLPLSLFQAFFITFAYVVLNSFSLFSGLHPHYTMKRIVNWICPVTSATVLKNGPTNRPSISKKSIFLPSTRQLWFHPRPFLSLLLPFLYSKKPYFQLFFCELSVIP